MRNTFLKNRRTIKIPPLHNRGGREFPLLEQFSQHSPCDLPGGAAGNAASDAPLFDCIHVAQYSCNSIQPASSFINAHNNLFDRSKKRMQYNSFWIRCKVKKQTECLLRCGFSKFEAAKSRRRMNWERKPKSTILIQAPSLPQKQLLLENKADGESRVPRMI